MQRIHEDLEQENEKLKQQNEVLKQQIDKQLAMGYNDGGRKEPL